MSRTLNAVCHYYTTELGADKTAWINAIEFMGGLYYLALSILGFRNMYVIFYKQQKYATIIFPLMYLFSQSVCIIQAAQCFFFFALNHKLKATCESPDSHPDANT